MPAFALLNVLFGSGGLTSDGIGSDGGLVNGVEKAGVVEGARARGSRWDSERMERVLVKLRLGTEGREQGSRAGTKRRRQRIQSIVKFNCLNGCRGREGRGMG